MSHEGKRLNIQVAFVHGNERKGRASQLTIPDQDLSVKDVRAYLIRCFNQEDGTEKDQKAIRDLLEACGIGRDSLESDPIEVRENLSGCFMEKDTPNWPVLERMHFLFLHHEPLK